MSELLNNPVYHALLSGDEPLSFGTDKVRYFDEAVSPFAGFEAGYSKGFDDLFDLLPAGRVILYATPVNIKQPKGWQRLQKTKGVQMVFAGNHAPVPVFQKPVRLLKQHVPQMLQLADLTKPGPFGPRTIEFGNYYGLFENGHLIAMAGQRLHVQAFTEVSAVCTHPDHLDRGYAAALVRHQVSLIQEQKQVPFLHVRRDNLRAIALYQRIGFRIREKMNFYVLKRRTRRRVVM